MAVFGQILLFFFKFCTFEKMPKNQLLAKKQVTLALMVLFGLFHLLKLARACTSSDKPEKVLCRFTDAASSLLVHHITWCPMNRAMILSASCQSTICTHESAPCSLVKITISRQSIGTNSR